MCEIARPNFCFIAEYSSRCPCVRAISLQGIPGLAPSAPPLLRLCVNLFPFCGFGFDNGGCAFHSFKGIASKKIRKKLGEK